MKLQEVTGYNSKTASILKESYQDLTEGQIIYLNKWEKELWPLVEQYTRLAEAELTKDQVIDIFNGAEKVAMDSGNNTTIAGKIGKGAAAAAKLPVDMAKAVDKKINELGRMAQNAGPIKNADQKFEQLKKDITAKNGDSKIVQGIQKVSDWAKENPGKASLAVGILTTIAAFAGGPAGGAAAGLILRASKDLLQGEKLSTAVGKSIKTGVYGALAGMAFKELTDNVLDNIASAQNAELDAMEAGMKAETFQAAKGSAMAEYGLTPDALDGTPRIAMSGNLNNFYYSYDTVIPPDMQSQYDSLLNAMDSAKDFSPEHYQAAAKFHDFMATMQNSAEAKNLTAAWDALQDIDPDNLTMDQLETLIAKMDAGDDILKATNDIGGAAAAAAQGAMQTVDSKSKEAIKAKPVDAETKKQLELDLKGGSTATPVDKNFDKSQKLSDFGPVGDKAESMSMEERFELYLAEADPAQGELPLDNPNSLGAKLKRGAKGLAGKAAGAVKGAAGAAAGAVKQTAKNIGNKVTADKLMKAWKAMGEPLDSGSIANILQDAGMSDEQIKSIGQTQSVELEPSAQDTAQTEPDAQDNAQTSAPNDADGDGKDDATGEPVAKKAPAVKDGPIEKGTIQNKGGKDYRWEGALWVDVETNKPLGVQASFDMGLPNPKLQPIIDAAKKDPELAKLIKAQVTAKGVKAGTAGAAKAAQAGVKGTEKLKTA